MRSVKSYNKNVVLVPFYIYFAEVTAAFYLVTAGYSARVIRALFADISSVLP